MKYLLFGNNGQLGKAFQTFFEVKKLKYSAFDIDQVDVGSLSDTYSCVKKEKPDVIINCTAFTSVDNSELEFIKAHRVNGLGVKNISFSAKKVDAFMVHFSTDYVFDGTAKNRLYNENDATNPINKYGESKLFGEELLKEDLKKYLIFRLSWLFGDGNQNFIKRILDVADKTDTLKVVTDEVSIPTFTETVVPVVMTSIKKGLIGTYHLTSSGHCSRYEWAKFIFEKLELNKTITEAKVADFDLLARRPEFSAMSNEKISKDLGITIPDWKKETTKFINKYILKTK